MAPNFWNLSKGMYLHIHNVEEHHKNLLKIQDTILKAVRENQYSIYKGTTFWKMANLPLKTIKARR